MWSLSVMIQAYSIKFKRKYGISQTLFDGGKRAQSIKQISFGGKRYSSIDDERYEHDAPPPNAQKRRQQRKLDINDVDLKVNSNKKKKKKEKQEEEEKYSERYVGIPSNSKESSSKTYGSFLFETVYDNTKERQNQGVFVVSFYIIGVGSLLFNIIWYAVHTQYIDQFVFKDDWLMPRWYFPYYHNENRVVIITIRAIISVWLAFMSLYLLKEFYNNKVLTVITINLMLYWILFAILIDNDIHSDEHDIFLFISPFFYYIIFFCLHISDTDRDEQPTSESLSVNVDKLEMFYTFWPALPYKTQIAPNIFCFGPSPRIESPIKSSIILLGGWGNIKEDYNRLAYLLSQYGRNVIVIDYRGVGETGLGPEANKNHDFYTSEQYADDIFDLIKQLFPHYNQQRLDHNDNDNDNNDDDDDDDDESDNDDEDESKSSEYDSKDELSQNDNNLYKNKSKRGHKVYLIGLSMGGNVALQCGLHEDAKKYLRGIAVCSGHGGAYLLSKGKNFEFYGNQIVTGNALHYGYCDAQKNYVQYAHSAQYRKSILNRCNLRLFYSWRLSTRPYYCCNFNKNIKSVRDKNVKSVRDNKRGSNDVINAERGPSAWFESKLSLNIRGVYFTDKHAIVEGIERQTDIAEEGFNVATIIHNISIPTLIYHGKQDTIIDVQTAKLLNRTIGDNAYCQIDENGGHNFWFENTKQFIQKIDEWMAVEEEMDFVSGAWN